LFARVSQRVISCNNKSKRVFIWTSTNHQSMMMVILVIVRKQVWLVKKKKNRRKTSRLPERERKAAKWQWQKGKIDRYLFVSGVLISINNYRHWQRRNGN